MAHPSHDAKKGCKFKPMLHIFNPWHYDTGLRFTPAVDSQAFAGNSACETNLTEAFPTATFTRVGSDGASVLS